MKSLEKGVGIWQILSSNLITDIIYNAGFNLVIFDLEHGFQNTEGLQNCLFTVSNTSIFTIARVPSIDYQNIVQVIDTGIDGLLFPNVETQYDIERTINNSLLSPKGKKSFSPFVPRYKYGKDKNNDLNPMIGILIESQLGIDNSEKLLSYKEVDFVYFGAYDLSVELNKKGDIFHDEIINCLKIVIKNAKIFNKKILSIYRNQDELKKLINLGVDFPIASVDTSLILDKFKEEYGRYFNSIS
tara:strand:- start:25 stop:753 length:729 start_codon:yes stop_codon:yes gene_type:complete